MENRSAPLYRVVAHKMGERIASREYPPGSPLPTEPLLGQEFGVSRITIRQALGLLKRQGLLYSRSGVGTLVRREGPPPGRMRMTGSLVDLINYGAQTEYTPVDRALVSPPRDIAKLLGLLPTGMAFRFRGLRSRPSEPPFGFEEVYIPEHLGGRIDNAALGGRTFFSMLEENNRMQITGAHQVITAVAVPATARRHLGIRDRAPALRVTRSYQVADGRTVQVAISHYIPARFEYIMTLYRE